MTVRPIVISGDPVLHSPATPVTSFDAELRKLIADMYETMDEAPGVGLAARALDFGYFSVLDEHVGPFEGIARPVAQDKGVLQQGIHNGMCRGGFFISFRSRENP